MRLNLDSHLRDAARIEIRELLKGKRVYASMGNRLLLNSFALVPAVAHNLVGGSTTEDETLADALRLTPDVLFVTEDLEVGYGISLIEKMRVYCPDLKTLLFLETETPEVVEKAMSSGADGVAFVSSIGSGDGDLIRGMRAISEGGTYFPGEVVQKVSQSSEERLEILNELSEREVDVLKCIADGCTNGEIAERLVISVATTKTHIGNILGKLQVRDRTKLAVLALKNQITADAMGQ